MGSEAGKGVTVVDGVSLTGQMIRVLLDHVAGERTLKVSDGDTLRALRARRLIRFNRLVRPWRTIVTSRGREVMAALLARMADAAAEHQLAAADT
jgi:hypothetical protein